MDDAETKPKPARVDGLPMESEAIVGNASNKPPEPPPGDDYSQPAKAEQKGTLRTVCVNAVDMVDEFNKFLNSTNPLQQMIMRELFHVHKLQEGAPIQFAGILIHCLENTDGEAPHRSRIIVPASFQKH